MKIGEEEIAATKKMFTVIFFSQVFWQVLFFNNLCKTLKGRISISLDTWTSPNNIAFLGIVAHYTNSAGDLGAFNIYIFFFIFPTYLPSKF